MRYNSPTNPYPQQFGTKAHGRALPFTVKGRFEADKFHIMTTYHIIKAVLPWVMSIVTIASMLLAGEKKRSAWIIGLLNQCLWSLFIVMTGNWGLAPLTVAMTIVYVRNLKKWRKVA